MTEKVPLTASEWKIMKELWKHSPLTMRNIQDSLYADTGWSKHTIITFLRRMLTKGTITVEEGKAKLYRPLLNEEQTIRTETRSMLERLYDGNLSLMVSSLVKHDELNDEEIGRLLRILQKDSEIE